MRSGRSEKMIENDIKTFGKWLFSALICLVQGSNKKKRRRVSSYFVRQCLSFISAVNSRDISVLGSFFRNILALSLVSMRKKIHPYLRWCLYVDTFCYINIGLVSVRKFQICACSMLISVFFVCLCDSMESSVLVFFHRKEQMSTNIPKI